jgi:hypothetical protein
MLLSHNARVNTLSKSGITPFHSAVVTGNIELARMLIAAGADLEAAHTNKITALMLVAKCDDVKMAAFLIDAGASVHALGEADNTLLHIAAGSDNAAMCVCLLDRGANINAVSTDGVTPLGTAIVMKASDILVEMLINRGASTTICDKDGWTPLHCAVETDQIHSARVLLRHGARMDAVDAMGITPAIIASRKFYNHRMLSLLSHPTCCL